MAEELSTESKLYVKEEIEKLSKEFKQDLKEAQSKATKTFTAVALIIGLLASVGVLGLAIDYAKNALHNTTLNNIVADANNLKAEIEKLKDSCEESLSKAKSCVDEIESLAKEYKIVPFYRHYQGDPYREICTPNVKEKNCKRYEAPSFYAFVKKP